MHVLIRDKIHRERGGREGGRERGRVGRDCNMLLLLLLFDVLYSSFLHCEKT